MINKTNLSLKLVVFTLILVGFFFTACSKMDGTYKEFIEGGEIRYSQKPDTIGISPGHNRVKAWLAVSSANVSKFKVYWNNRADSVEVPVVKASKVDTLSVMIENLAEGTYTFEFLTYDGEGNPSIAVDTVGEAFGDLYVNSLTNRLVRSASMLNDEVTISWFGESDDQVVRTEVKYKSQDGTEHLIKVGPDVNETKISERPLKNSLEYRTLFLPHPNAIDTFYTSNLPLSPVAVYVGFPETFEDLQYRKTNGNSTEDLRIGSGVWRFDKFLIGEAAGDRKNGSRAIRSHVDQTSIFEMQYDLLDGASKISFYHGICSADGPSKFKVQASQDGGTTWEDISEIYTNTATLVYREIILNVDGPIRFRFYKFSKAENSANDGRMNIDDINIQPN